jgi:hypothetical protein
VSFRSFLSQFNPPLGNSQVDAIVEEHTRLVEKAVEEARKEWRKKRRRKTKGLITATEAEEK